MKHDNAVSEELTGDQLAMQFVADQIKAQAEFDDIDRGTPAAFIGLLFWVLLAIFIMVVAVLCLIMVLSGV